MADLVKGVVGGGWGLLVGWILPSLVSILLLRFVVLQNLENDRLAGWLDDANAKQQGAALLIGAATLGLVLAGLKTQLYRVLEGYAGWGPKVDATGRHVRCV